MDKAEYIKGRVYRVIVYHSGGYSTGTCFFVDESRCLTCFHVAFSNNALSSLRANPNFLKIKGENEHIRFKNFHEANILKIEIELDDGARVLAHLEDFDEEYDLALLKVDLGSNKINQCDLKFDATSTYGSRVYFGGFPTHHDYEADKAPFAFQEGIISSIVETIVGGGKYEHLQINAISLFGNSGAPLFSEDSKVIGIMNGLMQFGADNVAFVKDDGQTTGGVFRIPLGISYVTSMKLLKEESSILSNYQ